MKKFFVVKKLSYLTFLMLLIPITVWFLEWRWTLVANLGVNTVDWLLFIVTETGSVPYAVITCILFILWLIWLTRFRYSWMLVSLVCLISLGTTQITKDGMKVIFKEPRPFVTQMFQADTVAFYALSKSEQEAVILKFAQPENQFVVEHQADELGYSFPSGHTIFAVSWMLMFAGLLFGMSGQAVIFAQIFTILWAGLILISRLRLGMHYPIDLFVSTLIAWGFHLIIFLWLIPFLEKWTLFKGLS